MDSYAKIKEFIEKNCLKEITGENVNHKGLRYVYIIEDLEKEKFYVGRRKCSTRNLFKEQYFGSGTINKRIVQKCKKSLKDVNDRLKRHILQICSDTDNSCKMEEKWILFFDATKNTLFYNIQPGGSGGAEGHGCSEMTKKKISEKHKGKVISEEQRQKISASSKGHKKSEETKAKMSEAAKGKTVSEQMRKKTSELKKGNRNCVGRKYSEETKAKMSEAAKGKVRSKETREKTKNSLINTYIIKKQTLMFLCLLLLKNYK